MIKIPKISVIVPVYNVSPYLKNCLDSILAQDFKDFELLIIDDGSTDGCDKICDQYAQIDSRIKVYHKKNGGISDARNFGIEKSQCDYISFIDSDDTVEKDMLSTLYENLTNHTADAAMCGLIDCYENKKFQQCKKLLKGTLDAETAIREMLLAHKLSVSASGKLYKKSLWSEVRFPKGKLYEDAFTTYKVIAKAQKVWFTTKPMYNYIHRKGSITTSKFSKKQFDEIDAYKEMLKFVQVNYPRLEKIVNLRILWAHIKILDLMIIEDFDRVDTRKKTASFIKKNILKLMCNNFLSFKRKISLLSLLCGEKLYSKIIKEYFKREKVLV